MFRVFMVFFGWAGILNKLQESCFQYQAQALLTCIKMRMCGSSLANDQVMNQKNIHMKIIVDILILIEIENIYTH